METDVLKESIGLTPERSFAIALESEQI
jgi:hypothetical protein